MSNLSDGHKAYMALERRKNTHIARLKTQLKNAKYKAERYEMFLVKIRDEAKRGMKMHEYNLACEALEQGLA